jgi:hypothetical protein
MTPRGWIYVSGFTWLAIGSLLTFKGLQLIANAIHNNNSLSVHLSGYFGSAQNGGSVLVALALILGMIKGRIILAKTVRRVVTRIRSLPKPILLKDVYSPIYLLLILSMIALGFSFRYLPISMDLRGMIDVAIGSALIHGAMLYFRAGSVPAKE